MLISQAANIAKLGAANIAASKASYNLGLGLLGGLGGLRGLGGLGS